MLCYKGMTFCPYNGCRKFRICERALLNDIKNRARVSNLFIAKYIDKPECYKE